MTTESSGNAQNSDDDLIRLIQAVKNRPILWQYDTKVQRKNRKGTRRKKNIAKPEYQQMWLEIEEIMQISG